MNNIFHINTLDEVLGNIKTISEITDNCGWSAIRGLVDKDYVMKLKQHLFEQHDRKNEIKISGTYKKESADFQRLDIGEFGASSRLNRYFMFFPWNENKIFNEINSMQLQLLRTICNKDINYGVHDSIDSLDADRFTMSYAIQYPQGGGFMSTHREYNQKDKGDRAYVVYLALTEKGIDYHSGGAFVKLNDKKKYLDENLKLGDMVIYRGDMYHGVESIDLEKKLDLENLCGRIILTTVFKYFA